MRSARPVGNAPPVGDAQLGLRSEEAEEEEEQSGAPDGAECRRMEEPAIGWRSGDAAHRMEERRCAYWRRGDA
jgi:hypothetical protein